MNKKKRSGIFLKVTENVYDRFPDTREFIDRSMVERKMSYLTRYFLFCFTFLLLSLSQFMTCCVLLPQTKN